jgi:hypothetical protein
VPLPAGYHLYPELLRAAGYYFTNNAKTDYNFTLDRKPWDENGPRAHFRNRPAGQPFFAIFNQTSSHESQVAPAAGKTTFRVPPERVTLPPYHPDTPEIRRDWANYHDQIPVMEELCVAAGFTTWAMVQWEADDALGAAAKVAEADPRVEQVRIVTPDKDLGQCVRGTRVVQYDRRKKEILDETAVEAKFGVPPDAIADYLALVGDSADGFPGLPGWGAKSASTVLATFGSLEAIPPSSADWGIPSLRGAEKLAATLRDQMELALLFRRIATVETDVAVGTVDDWRWAGPRPEFEAMAIEIGAPGLWSRATQLAAAVARPPSSRTNSAA